jgi:16S rRNA processing protein RimM
LSRAGASPRRVLVATIGAAHGVKGEVRVKAHNADPLSLGAYGPLAADDGRVFEIERVRPGKGVVIVKFSGVDDRTAAEALNGISLYVDRERLPAIGADEFYHADLIGLAASREDGAPLGIVIAVHNFGAGDMLEIAPSRGKTLLVPFTKEAVPVVDIAAGTVTIVPPAEIEVRGGEAEAGKEST